MADASQVGLALAYVWAGIFYPEGLEEPSVTGRQTIVRRGWLLPSDIFAAQNIRNNTDFLTVTLAPQKGVVVPEPLGRPWQVQARVLPTVSVKQSTQAVRIAFPSEGAPSGVVGVWYEAGKTQISAAYAVTEQDTPETVALALAGQLPKGLADGNSVQVPGYNLAGNVVGYGQSVRVNRRQNQRYRVSLWTADSGVRDTLGQFLDTELAEKSWISTLDGRQAQLRFVSVEDIDTMQNQALYRRDYLYELVFDTLQVQWSSDMMFGAGTVSAGDQVSSFGAIEPAFDNSVVLHALEAMQAAQTSQAAQNSYPGMMVNQFGTVVCQSH